MRDTKPRYDLTNEELDTIDKTEQILLKISKKMHDGIVITRDPLTCHAISSMWLLGERVKEEFFGPNALPEQRG